MSEYNGFNGFNLTDTTYAGTVEAEYIITNATFGMDTVNKGLAMVKSGIKKRHNIERMDVAYPLQQRIPTPTSDPNRTVLFDGVALDPKSVMGFQELLPQAFEQNFFAEQLSDSLLSRQLPNTPSNFLLKLYLERCFEQVERGIWMGSTTYGSTTGSTYYGVSVGDPTPIGQIMFFDGVIKQMLEVGPYSATTNTRGYVAPASVNATTIDITTIEPIMRGMYTSVPRAILANPKRKANLRFVMSVEDALTYEAMLTLTTFKNNNYTEEGISKYRGIPVVGVAGLEQNAGIALAEFIATPDSNLWIGLNSAEDMKLELNKLYNHSEFWFIKFLFKVDVGRT